MPAPEFIRLLVAAEVAHEIDREDEVVEIPIFEKLPTGECLKLQLWFMRGQPICCSIESIDSDGSPRYLNLFSGKTEVEFKKKLSAFAQSQNANPKGDEQSRMFARIVEILGVSR